MKANIENLIKAVKLCAEAHKAEFCDWSEDGQLGIKSDSVATLADVQTICRSFYGLPFNDIEQDWGYTTIWLSDDFLDEVDVDLLQFGLPSGWVERMAA